MGQKPKRLLRDLLPDAVAQLRMAGVSDPVLDARLLLAHAANISAERLSLFLSDPLVDDTKGIPERFAALIARRAQREPVSHLVGGRLFWGRRFHVGPQVLDPRPETEVLIAAALERPFHHVLDLGTGSGCLLLTLLAENPRCDGVGVDLSPDALTIAAANAKALGLADRSTFLCGHWFEALADKKAPTPVQKFDLIVSNPPYIAAQDMATLAPEVRDYEPPLALTDGGDGLSAYRSIAAHATEYLQQEGRLIVEFGSTQAEAVKNILMQAGFASLRIFDDMDGRARAIEGLYFARDPR